jgi:hypothetical protein
MSSLRFARSPVQSSGLDRLACWLAGEGYHQAAIARLLIYTYREGTPTGAPDLDREDEEMAEHAFVEGQEPMPGVSAEWDEHGTEPGRGPVYRSLGADYTLDRLGWTLEQMQAALADTDEMPLPPISGGAPESAPTHCEIGTFYRGGSFPRTWYLHRHGDLVYMDGYDTGGSFHSSSSDIKGELEYADSLGPDEPERLREHHAFAVALRAALKTLGIPDPTVLPPISGGAPVSTASAEEVRRWYDERPAFSEWVEAEGGVEWEED